MSPRRARARAARAPRAEVSRASRSAIMAIEAAGGTVTCAHYNKLAVRALLKPEKFPVRYDGMLEVT